MSDARNPFTRFLTRYKRGDILFEEGDEGDTMFIVQSGQVAIRKRVATGEALLATMEKGDFFGEMSVLERQPRSAKAEMAEDGALIVINSETFGEMLKTNPEIAVRMLRKYSLRLRDMNRQLEELAAQQAGSPASSSAKDPRATLGPTPAAQPIAFFVSAATGASYPVIKNESLIGRFDSVTGMRPDIDLSNEDQSRNISRRHARIVAKEGKFFLAEEIGAMNGTFINGKRLANGVLTPLGDGDEITLCRLGLRFKLPTPA